MKYFELRFTGNAVSKWQAWLADMASLVNSGISITSSLEICQQLAKETDEPKQFCDHLETLCRGAKAGNSISKACELIDNIPKEIGLAFFCAEKTGNLAETLIRHCERWQKATSSKRTFVRSLIYPVFTLAMSSGAWLLLSSLNPDSTIDWEVKPSLENILIATGLVSILAALFGKQSRKLNNKKRLFNSKRVGANWLLSDIFFSVAEQLTVGIPLDKALTSFSDRLSKNNRRAHSLLSDFQEYAQSVIYFCGKGVGLAESSSLAGAPQFLVHRAKLAETTGELDACFYALSSFFALRAERRQQRIQAIAGPLTLVIAATTLVSAYLQCLAPLYESALGY